MCAFARASAMTAARQQPHAPKVPSRRSASTRFYWFFSVTVAFLIAFEAFLTSLPFADAIPDYAEALQQRQLDSYFQMIQLLITLATLVMGGITGFVINKGREIGLNGRQLR